LAADASYADMEKSIDTLLSRAQLLRLPEEKIGLGVL